MSLNVNVSSQWTTWGLSFMWLGWIIRYWLLAKHHADRLAQHAEVLSMGYQSNSEHPTPFLHPMKYLQIEGWKASGSLSRQDMIAYWRSAAQTDKQKMAAYIEMMPQLGLLGTVLSLFFAAFIFEFNISTLGLALVTTVFGLSGALSARTALELPTEQHYFNVMELLQNEHVIESLIQMTYDAERRESEALEESSIPLEEEHSSVVDVVHSSNPPSSPLNPSSIHLEKSTQQDSEDDVSQIHPLDVLNAPPERMEPDKENDLTEELNKASTSQTPSSSS